MMSNMFLPICNHFHARQANSSKIIFLVGAPLFLPSFIGTPLTHEILKS